MSWVVWTGWHWLCVMSNVSSKQADTAAAHFNLIDDSSDDVSSIFKNRNYHQSLYWRDWAERYVKGEFEIVLGAHPSGSGEVTNLIFFRIPDMRKNADPGWKQIEADVDIGALKGYTSDEPVLAYIAESIENPERIALPSLVRFKRPKKRKDFHWDVLAATSAYYIRFEFRGGVSNREVGEFGFPLSDKGGRCVSGVIKRGPQMFDSLQSEQIENAGDGFGYAELVDVCKPIRVRIDNHGVWPSLKESRGLNLQRIQMFVCAPDPESCAAEWARGKYHV